MQFEFCRITINLATEQVFVGTEPNSGFMCGFQCY